MPHLLDYASQSDKWWRLSHNGWVAALGILGLFAIVNALSYRPTHIADGYDTWGWPYAFYKRGGFAGGEQFVPFGMVLDTLIAMMVAYGIGILLSARPLRFDRHSTAPQPR